MSLKFWSNTYFLLAQSELTRAVSVLELFFFCFRKDAVFSTKSWSSQECPFYIFSGFQLHPSTCFFPSVLGITQSKQKPIFNINLSFFLIYFLCGKKGFFFGVMRVLGVSGEFEKINKTELFIPNTGEKNARKEKKISWFKAVCLQIKTQTKSVSLFCMQLKSQTLTISSRSYLPS